MPINVAWDNSEKTVIRYTFEGRWTWQEYFAAIQDGVTLISGLTYRVNMIIDLSEGSLVPQNLLSRVMRSMQTPPAQYDLAVVVTKSRFIESLLSLIARISPALANKHPVVKSLDEARAILNEHDRQRSALPEANKV